MTPQPIYWLVFIAQAPDTRDDPLEIAALMPGYVDRTGLTDDARRVLGAAHAYHLEHLDQRLVFFAEITSWIEREKHLSWSDLDVDFEHALSDLDDKAPILYLEVDAMTFAAVGDTSRRGATVLDPTTGGTLRANNATAKRAVLNALDAALAAVS